MKNKYLQIAIDGTSASGKGTVAKLLSKHIGVPTLDTGALYRGVAVHMINCGVSPDDMASVKRALESLDIDITGGALLLNGVDVIDKIRTEEVSKIGPSFAMLQPVRDFVGKITNQILGGGDIIVEGRDIGSVVLPNAPFKFFVTADVAVRAYRRHLQLVTQNPNLTVEEVKRDLELRDYQDMNRAVAPLVRVPEAIYIDTTNLTPAQVIEIMAGYIQ